VVLPYHGKDLKRGTLRAIIEQADLTVEEYKYLLFEGKQEYELVYAGKEREEDIIANPMAVPLQPVKTFGENDNGWTNMLIFGDNLQVLKTLLQMKRQGKLKNADGTPGVKMVYIDPPFGTGDVYDAKGDAPAYSAKLQGVKYIEFLRKRLVFIKEVIANDGMLFIRIDHHFGHYVKAILDEIFGKENFQNEFIVNRIRKNVTFQGRRSIPVATDSVFLYFRSSQTELVSIEKVLTDKKAGYWHALDSAGIRYPRERTFGGKVMLPPNGRHWTFTQQRIEKMTAEGKLRLNPKTGRPEYWIEPKETITLDTNWTDIPGYTFTTGYPTENSESLLQRVVTTGSKPGDLLLDCFAGSGTALAVAEKLGRRWIGVDCGKLAIYTMQKRLLNIANSKDLESLKRKYGKPCKPFTLYYAGLYDYQRIKKLPWTEYRGFALKLFQCRVEPHSLRGIQLDGYIGADHVLVFHWQKGEGVVLDPGFIDDLHRALGERVGTRFFIIAPAASVAFLEDYIQKGNVSYFVLRIPYSIIDEIHRAGFSSIRQPADEADVNEAVDAVGFDFIRTPEVECNYTIDEPKDKTLLNKDMKEAVIEIRAFRSTVISRKPLNFANRETLAMVMLDYDYDGEVFNVDEYFFAEQIAKNDWQVRFDTEKIDGKMMIIYMDIFGNEKREVKRLEDFVKGAR
jgi:site-specific DNA-methyltransferase (adenine-specific)/adenine-specific DNA-methyltransferase